jgi:hypothetical protein
MRLWWDNMTPFILPVVPEEKQMELSVSLPLFPARSKGGRDSSSERPTMSSGNWPTSSGLVGPTWRD